MISFIDYFGTLLSRTDEMRGIVIIESKRNAYAWLGMSFLSKKMKRLFPPLLLFHVIPDIYGTRYMSTTKPEGCITIENYQNISSEMLDDKFMDAVGYLLKDDNREATITHIKELMQEFKQDGNQHPPHFHSLQRYRNVGSPQRSPKRNESISWI